MSSPIINIHFSPVKPELSDKSKAAFKIFADNYLKNNPDATLEDYMTYMRSQKGISIEQYDKLFGTLALGFYDAKGQEYVYADVKKLYDSLVKLELDLTLEDALKIYNDEIQKKLDEKKKTAEETSTQPTTLEDKIEQQYNEIQRIIAEAKELEEVDAITGRKIVYVGDKTTAPTIKIPFVGNLYDVISKDGEVIFENNFEKDKEFWTTAPKSDRDKRSIMLDPDMLTPGTTVRVYIPKGGELMDETVSTWYRDEQGALTKGADITFAKWLENNPDVKEGSKEWLDKVPVRLQVNINGEWVEAGYSFHDTDWWNERNVADRYLTRKQREDVATTELEQARKMDAIEKGKELTSFVRNKVWELTKEKRESSANDYLEMVVEERTPGRSLKYQKQEDYKTLSEANNSLVVGVITQNSVGQNVLTVSVNGLDNVDIDPSLVYNRDILEKNADNLSSKGKLATAIPYTKNAEGKMMYLVQLHVDNSELSQPLLKKAYNTKAVIWKLHQDYVKNKDLVRREKLENILKKFGMDEISIKEYLITPTDSDINRVLDMYPKYDKDTQKYKLNSNKEFLNKRFERKGQDNFNLLILEDGKLQVYKSENAFQGKGDKKGDNMPDNSFTQFIKDTIYTNNVYTEINDLKNGGTKFVADVQPKIELNFSVEGIAKRKSEQL